MRIHCALLAAVALFHGASMAAGREGLWFMCLPEMDSSNILSIKREGTKYVWKLWWGQYESGDGYVQFEGKQAILFGCKSYRGEVEKGCGEKSPPKVTQFSLAELQEKHRSLDLALKGGAWIRTSEAGRHQLDRECGAIRESISKRAEPR